MVSNILGEHEGIPALTFCQSFGRFRPRISPSTHENGAGGVSAAGDRLGGLGARGGGSIHSSSHDAFARLSSDDERASLASRIKPSAVLGLLV